MNKKSVKINIIKDKSDMDNFQELEVTEFVESGQTPIFQI